MRVRCLFSLLATVALTGCPSIQGPGYLHPGSAAYQQAQAERFDPFPQTDVGPDMAARPLAYMRPAPETERNQNATTFIERYGQPPPPGTYRAPRSVPGRQAVPYQLPPAPPAAPVFVQ